MASVTIEPHVRAAALLGLLASAFGTVRYGTREGLSVALGATVAIVNLLVVAWMVRGLSREASMPGSPGLRGLLVFKPIALLLCTLALLKLPFVSGLAFVLGVAVLPVGMALGEVRART
jgi:hypothetical protein